MRKFILIFLLLFSTNSYGQKFGISVGVNRYNISGHNIPTPGGCCKFSISDYNNYQNVYGINFGGSVDFNLYKTLSIFSELQFSQKGYKADDNEVSYSSFNILNYDRRLTLNYLELPILLKLNIAKQKKWSPYALGGVYFSYLLRSKLQLEDVPSNRSNPIVAIDEFDWGVRLGIGVQRGKFAVDLNFVGGLGDISSPNYGFGIRTKNTGVNATVRYIIND